jgi:hypothetical protein
LTSTSRRFVRATLLAVVALLPCTSIAQTRPAGFQLKGLTIGARATTAQVEAAFDGVKCGAALWADKCAMAIPH